VPRLPDPQLEQRILSAASRLWARGGEKALTMRAVARAAGTTTPTVYERYRDRDNILRALRRQTRNDLFAALSRTRTLREAIHSQFDFALEHPHAYEVLFDGVGRAPSLHEPWPSFNLIRERLAERLGGTPRQHNRLMLSVWCLMHGASMLIIRGRFEGALREQTVHACIDAIEAILDAAQANRIPQSGLRWPRTLILGEGKRSRAGDASSVKPARSRTRKNS
jgi:AcrR family transcriptional regulator